ncbi:polyadenylate-binding protein 2 [Medicago truncatula]|uniref:RNA recognition motif n=1 Tax=Medicago truncatula TaxID=3880 RepID=A0A072VTD7_MEDTR|nr:polyadenylate-binding protein 2 [Medicago truncatula]XP_039690795.1 polyadenylate-binding protein 2 [Medicago truncatula]XP_039690796.1 polyadenylate-binding protein 2 [Medicago truncatula]KEH41350.1 RNA recognition motif [Medicago truncatula]
MQFVKGTSSVQGSSGSSASQAVVEEVDARSVYVGNVDYACTAKVVKQHFQSCGIVSRVTILLNEYCLPKGCAYVEFQNIDAVPKALLLNESELYGRKIKVCAKRTNIPGMNQHRGRNTYVLRSRRPPPVYRRPGYGSAPRFRRSMRYRPY